MPSPTSTGRTAEQLAADYLAAQGFAIVDRNWRNRWCEIDIIARRGRTLHFVEVKYRASTAYGLPAEYINHAKTVRLVRAASAYNQAHRHFGPYQIDVASVTGSLDAPVIEYLANAIGI